MTLEISLWCLPFLVIIFETEASPRAFMCLSPRRDFLLATLPQSPNRWRVAVMVVLLAVSLISTHDLGSYARVTIGFLVTSLTKALLPIAQFGWVSSSRKSPSCSKFLPFKNYGGHLETFNATDIFSILPQICA